MKKLILKHSLTTYFFLAYFIAWGGILLSFGSDGIRVLQGGNVLAEGFSKQLFVMWLAMLAGPSVAGILLTLLLDGKGGLKNLISFQLTWKVNPVWYAAALLLIPLALSIIFYSFSFISPKFSPSFLLGFGIIVGLIGGFFEEVGWTGFALPKLQLHYSPFSAAIILGVIHTFWHLLADALGTYSLYQDLYILHFLLWLIALTAFRVIAVWIYNQSKSLLLAQLTHASFTGSQIILTPPTLNGPGNVVWYAAFAIALWVIVGVIIYFDDKVFFSKELKENINIPQRSNGIPY